MLYLYAKDIIEKIKINRIITCHIKPWTSQVFIPIKNLAIYILGI